MYGSKRGVKREQLSESQELVNSPRPLFTVAQLTKGGTAMIFKKRKVSNPSVQLKAYERQSQRRRVAASTDRLATSSR